MREKALCTIEREMVKKCLQQYRAAQERRKILQRRVEMIVQEERRGDICGAAEIKKRLQKQQEKAKVTMLRVMDIIDLLPQNSVERTVVELRHIDCKKWERICKDIHMSRSRTNDYYNAALDAIAQDEQARLLFRLLTDGEKERG